MKEYDLVVIGAGPHSLSLLSRILEKSPFAVINETEHTRLSHLSRKQQHKKMYSMDQVKQRILVIDKYGSWLSRWNSQFQKYSISHLRSPLYFHPDPFHPDALRAFAEMEKRTDELFDITEVMTNACKKSHKRNKKSFNTLFNSRDREQFYAPSRQLFDDFCSSLVDRYELDDVIQKGVVSRLGLVDDHFHVFVEGQEEPVVAKRVVCALGNTNYKNIPSWYHSIPPEHHDKIRHAIDFVDQPISIPKRLEEEMSEGKDSKILIVGGGLTSAQLVQQALNLGFKRVALSCRGKLKVKQFDLDLEWVGRTSFMQFAKFWNQDFKGRLGSIRNAKGGGSVTPEYFRKIECWKQDGLLEVLENSTIKSVCYEDNAWTVTFANDVQNRYDIIWLATGGLMDISRDPLFSEVHEKHPIDILNGLPALTKDLQWCHDLELYLMSGYASLAAGPNATNLQGGRIIAERLGTVLWEKWLKDVGAGKTEEIDTKPVLTTLADMAGNFGNYWSALVDAE